VVELPRIGLLSLALLATFYPQVRVTGLI